MIKTIRKIRKYGFRGKMIIHYLLHQKDYDFIIEQYEKAILEEI